ncbi:MAG: SRPBCC domain-containing protein [Flavobacteriales bacterium]|nr:SRPBCC domain-containing protein [Flavobacteriales bacterium]NQX98073.1 SRPBCC domain-containing protein [Flavobacteriales bacterium]
MKEINTEIIISSTPNEVWETLMDLDNWPKWNPIVNNIYGKLDVGGELSITMADSKGNASKKYKAIVIELEKNKKFSFSAIMIAKFMFSADRIIELKETEEGTLFTQREIYKGIMVSMFWGKLCTDAVKMLNSMNQALKKEVEK